MSTVEQRAFAAYGCVICASNAVVATVSIERNGVMDHYPTCALHIEQTTRRVLIDLPPVRAPMGERVIVHHEVGGAVSSEAANSPGTASPREVGP